MSFLVGVCGATGSGKTTASKLIREELQRHGVLVGVLSMDDFYRELTAEQHELALANEYDFDCLESFDRGLLKATIADAKAGKELRFRGYDHATHRHREEVETLGPFDVVVFEGLYLFADAEVAKLFDFRIFMDVQADECLIRRIRRDIIKRRRTVEGVLQQYERYVMPAYERLVGPSRKHAHVIIPRGAHNEPAMSSVYSHIRAAVKSTTT